MKRMVKRGVTSHEHPRASSGKESHGTEAAAPAKRGLSDVKSHTCIRAPAVARRAMALRPRRQPSDVQTHIGEVYAHMSSQARSRQGVASHGQPRASSGKRAMALRPRRQPSDVYAHMSMHAPAVANRAVALRVTPAAAAGTGVLDAASVAVELSEATTTAPPAVHICTQTLVLMSPGDW